MLKQIISALVLLALAGCSVAPPEPELEPIKPPKPGPTPHVKVGNPYSIEGITYHPVATAKGYDKEGVASWYGSKFHGKLTANGEIYDMHTMTAAHKTLPLPTIARVTNLQNGKKVVVRINDRGPFVGNRIIDLSYEAAKRLGFAVQGTTKVRVQSLTAEPKMHHGPEDMLHQPSLKPAKSLEVNLPVIPTESGLASRPEAGPRLAAVAPKQVLVQVGAFSNQGNAQRVLKRIHHLGPTEIQPVPNRQPPLYRVRLGPVTANAKLQEMLEKLVALGFKSSRIVEP
ncbi:septal ring lytic transglycosylase RlpA family protein [Magnetococcus sp. PR-3]|uniref:septal ring lytic transglycosylase RlpA family protein n=1 Tax=Magnetococcus sp. PR-3 TaxID=3120355 RepID=UPI002FCE30C5